MKKIIIFILFFFTSINLYASELKFEKIIDNLNNPWSLSFVDNENIIFTEKSGKLFSFNLKNKKIVAVEGKGGTQKMLERCKSMKFRKQGVLVKFPKKKQDLRIDLPTIGLKTLLQCKLAGLKGIVLKSKRNVCLERKKCINFVNKNKMFLTAI